MEDVKIRASKKEEEKIYKFFHFTNTFQNTLERSYLKDLITLKQIKATKIIAPWKPRESFLDRDLITN